MSQDADKFDLALKQVVAAKAAWRKHASSLTGEEKVAVIERMWVRDAELKRIREANIASHQRTTTVE
jgi:hypothetical protein